ncbi:GtrA family protein [Aeromicrobium phragmitis]|uniref:GtrA family protein n=1 Tax=Aeromicrobium phragmitis TaxID=2478914 RepID=A0A3L8PPG9_9ACTN|nr:GtrA family protein [Aeromicrobium phragmitis]RLV56593.1 GtrA family protein [Aeromicrobium phragmitis]
MRVTLLGFRRHLRLVVGDHRSRFLAVGATNTFVGYALFVAFDTFIYRSERLGYLLSLGSSYAISIALAFWLYRVFVFQVSGSVVRDFAVFVMVNCISVGINAVMLTGLVELFELWVPAAQAAALVLTTLISYFGHRYLSFGRSTQSGEGGELAPREALEDIGVGTSHSD